VPSRPSDNIGRQNRITSNDNALHETLSEDERQVEPGVPRPVVHQTDRIVVAKWQIKSTYYYLMFTSMICIAAILIDPSDNVRLVALAIWASAAGVGGALLSRTYRKL